MSAEPVVSRFVAPAHPHVTPLAAFQDNYIWLVTAPGNAQAVVVDPGDASPVEAALQARKLTLVAILLTHHHSDHVGGVAQLVDRHGPLAVFGPRDEEIDRVTRPLVDGERGEIAQIGLKFEVLAVPGHTRGHIAYACAPFGGDARGVLFCGDTLFAAGCGRLFEGTPEQMHTSLGRLAALPAETLVYCAHEYTESNLRFARAVHPDDAQVAHRAGEAAQIRAADRPTVPSTVGIERATNPFLRTDDPSTVAAVTARLGRPPQGSVEAFAALRAWKDGFR